MSQPSHPAPSEQAQPQIVQKLLKRTALFLFLLAIIFGGYRYLQTFQGDYDLGGTSAGMVAAIRREDDGQQVVLIGTDGAVKTTKSWKPGVTDREPAWAPDGRFLYFCTDREESTFNVFRWNPQKDDAESRTIGRTSRAAPTFAPDDTGESLLMVSGGNVRELDPKTKKTPQILPPTDAEIAQGGDDESGGSGTQGAFGAIYGSLGSSFRVARYLPGRTGIAAIMRRDEGEVLVVQILQPGSNGKLPRPQPVAAGDRIDFDIDPKGGKVVYTIQNFRWPDPKAAPEQFRKDGRVTVPFRNVVGIVDPSTKDSLLVGASGDDKVAFGSPRFAPDGARFVMVQGLVEDGSLRPTTLATVPAVQGGIQQAAVLARGEVYEPAFSADGARLVYAKRVGGKRDLFTMGSDGTGEKSLTGGKGDFLNPAFSPGK